MNNLLVIVVLVVVGFQLVRHVGRKALKSSNEASWQKMLAHPDSDEMLETMFGISHGALVVSEILIRYRISYIRFASNHMYLETEGESVGVNAGAAVRDFRFVTPSIKNSRRRIGRPLGLPIWFLAAFPDVVDWLNSDEGIDRIEDVYKGAEDLAEHVFSEADHEPDDEIRLFQHIVDYYLRNVRSHLEVREVQ